ncbi:hypothetical protein NX059_003683 [Plenodomus lindquistii]|nr:hypothetical protein NX059_003683 [Plenodomus lindquistii]
MGGLPVLTEAELESHEIAIMKSQAETLTDALELRNLHHSPLLRLPGELRNRIYEYVFTGIIQQHPNPNGIKFTSKICSPMFKKLSTKVDSTQSTARFRGLLLVSRKIYAETRLLAFQMNEFEVFRVQGLNDFFSKFSDEQRQKITVPKFTSRTLPMIQEAFKEMPALPNLKRVVVRDTYPGFDKEIEVKQERESKMARVMAGLGYLNAKVTFE